MAMAAASVGRLARLRAGWKAWRAKRLAAKARRVSAKKARIRQKTGVAAEEAKLAKQKALKKGYRKGTLSPTGVALAGSAPIGAGLGAAALAGIGTAVGAGIEAAGEVASAAMAREGQAIPDIEEAASPVGGRFNNDADRRLYLKLARLDARTRLRLAQKQRETAREVAFLTNPVIGIGIAAAIGYGTYTGLHMVAEYRDKDGNQPRFSGAAQEALSKIPAPSQPTLPNLPAP